MNKLAFWGQSKALLMAALLVAAGPALAVDGAGLFELEGNAVDDSGGPAPDDWETLHNGGGSAFVFTGINPDPAPNSIFTGGRKDIQDIPQWAGKSGAVPDKGDITNAYAAAYKCPAGLAECAQDDLIVYFGADRISNVGDTFLGFWFFKDNVSFDPATGSFSGNHVEGDTLVLVNFPQAANAQPLIQVIQWDPACLKAASSTPQPGQCAAKNLRLIDGESGAGAICGSVANDDFCAVTNDEGGAHDPTPSPWDYMSKDGFVNQFPFETFFEGGINLGALTGEACFASFMAETRSSSSFTASLKDFRLDQFPVCSVELSKDCGLGTWDPETDQLKIPYSITITNTGAGPVSEIVATDDGCGFGDQIFNFGPLGAGESETQDGFCFVPAGTDLSAGFVLNGVTAEAEDVTVTFSEEGCVAGPDPEKCYAICTYEFDPAIGVTKRCRTRLVAEDGVVKVKVEFAGDVTNTSSGLANPVPLGSVTVFDDKAGGPLELFDADGVSLGTSVRLDPSETAFFSGSYLPDGSGELFSECPSSAVFLDTVTASGVDLFEGFAVEEVANADCDLCADDNCEPL